MHIIVCPDNSYTMPCGVMLCSLFENNKAEDICIHVITSDIYTQDNKNLLIDIANKYGQAMLFHTIDDRVLSNIPLGQDFQVKIPIVTLYRIFIADLISSDIDKVLYLDSDIIVSGSLTSLYKTNVDKYAVGAVIDTYNNNILVYNNLRYPPSVGYFNAGVLLINLSYWRDKDVNNRCMEFANNNPERLKFLDQDILNYVLRDEKLWLPIRYNVQTHFLYKEPNISWEYEDELQEATSKPVVLHFTGSHKPWFIGYNHPYRNEFFKYRNLTVWANDPLTKSVFSSKDRIKSILNNILYKLGLKSRPVNRNPFIDIQK